ncbi:MAG: alpha/beta hydrolase [Limosilactobacillus gorillae]|jgi:acetyl esterase/lipase|uniref:alpha/beta hydrolase n=1 Tax=Limosilactobacillus gorillae TaxID=1450649 RepID=UPI000A3E4BBF|nr:alpha/beta hydrolase [Limosilactobacillus gorillae]MDO4855141.1 alpha/beta hydrolase [Limosilactobacillus gorillae]
MEIKTLSLTTSKHPTPATLTAYLQTPTPKAPVQAFPALVFVPGGSMTHIPEEESEKTALAFLARGFQVFVLRYSFVDEATPLYPSPLLDLAQAVNLVHQHQNDWSLTGKVAVMGFSAGGQIVALYNDYWKSGWLKEASGLSEEACHFDAAVLGYPVIDLDLGFPNPATMPKWTNDPERFSASYHVNADCRPTFTWGTVTDPLITVQNTLNYVQALQQENISQEIHLFDGGPHAMDIATDLVGPEEEPHRPHVHHWVTLADEWLKQTLN